MSTLFGTPLVGSMFTPVVVVITLLYFMMSAAQWLQQSKSKQVQPNVTSSKVEGTEIATQQELTNEDGQEKKKKKKKSCCGTKGSCCKTKKDSGDEKKGGCGCGCGSKKEGEGSCSSEAEGSDSDTPQVLDVEELGRMAEGLRPELATHSPPRTLRSNGMPLGRVRLRTSDQSKKQQQEQLVSISDESRQP